MTIVCLLLSVAFIALSVALFKTGSRRLNGTKKYISVILAIFILAVGLEVSLFNYNFYSSKSLEKIECNQALDKASESDKYFTVKSGDIIEITDINEKLHNVYINLYDKNNIPVKAKISITDESNEYPLATPERTLYKGIEKSQYINLHTLGKSQIIRIKLTSEYEEEIKIKSLSLNEERGFIFSSFRVFLIFAALLFLYIFNPKSPIYKIRITDCKNVRISLAVGFIALFCVIFTVLGTINPAFLGISKVENGIEFTELSYEHHNQYDELAQAILNGKVYIDNNDIPQSLKEMKNPYDSMARYNSSQLTGDEYRWDVAYFEGHYYVYFGIVPLLIMYLPFRLVFDAPFPSAIGAIIFCTLFAAGIYLLLELILRKYFAKTSLGAFLLLALSTASCSGAMFLAKRPDFYSLPIICGLAFSVFGLYFWLRGLNSEKKENLYYFLGSLSLALAVGSRPQSVLISALALPLFIKPLLIEKKLFRKGGIINLICLGIPYVIVAAGIMYYNYIRFKSPFDFGSSYNLTTNDVANRGFVLGRTGLGIFTYLFQPPQFTATFPYIRSTEIDTNYMGKTVYEACFGGLLVSLPFLWFTPFIAKARKKLKEKGLFAFTVMLLLIGLSLVIADTQAGGLLQRYYSDFGYVFFIACSLIIAALYSSCRDDENVKNLDKLLLISTILSLIYTICLVFSVSDVTIDTTNPELYGRLLHLVEFWL